MNDIIDALTDAIERPFESDTTRCYIVNALMKLAATHGTNSGVEEILGKYCFLEKFQP